jgi:hypothetical protein
LKASWLDIFLKGRVFSGYRANLVPSRCDDLDGRFDHRLDTLGFKLARLKLARLKLARLKRGLFSQVGLTELRLARRAISPLPIEPIDLRGDRTRIDPDVLGIDADRSEILIEVSSLGFVENPYT